MKLSKFIDHTLLKPTATEADIKKLCGEAEENDFYAVCVNPVFVKLAKECLKGTNVKVACVIGFPLGANCTEVKKTEAEKAILDGAEVASISNGDHEEVVRLNKDLNDLLDKEEKM